MSDITEKIDNILKEEIKVNSIQMAGIIRGILEESEDMKNTDIVQKGNDLEILYNDGYFKVTIRFIEE